MPTRLVIATDDVLGTTARAPDPSRLEALAQLGHVGIALAIVLGPADDGIEPPQVHLQRLMGEAGGHIDAFFHRGLDVDGLAEALGEAAERWRLDLTDVPCVVGNPDDATAIAAAGGRPVLFDGASASDLAVLVDGLLGTAPNDPTP
jgi:hypothetical protein